MEYREEDFLMLSGIQHFVFCRRQWALIHVEQQWEENLRTIEGSIMHENAHGGAFREKRGDIAISRGMAVFSRSLGISGICDIVEFHKSEEGIQVDGLEGCYDIIPIEYKKGKPKEHDADVLQLVAQAMCLEEMLVCNIDRGYLYYGENKRRTEVAISEELRKKTELCCKEMHKLYERRYTPKVKTSKACNACSVKNLCLPQLCKNKSVSDYINMMIKGEK